MNQARGINAHLTTKLADMTAKHAEVTAKWTQGLAQLDEEIGKSTQIKTQLDEEIGKRTQIRTHLKCFLDEVLPLFITPPTTMVTSREPGEHA